MGFLAPAVPWIVKGGAMLGGALFGRHAQNAAQERSPEEAAALSGATGAGNSLMQQGQALTSAGMPAVQGASTYWQTLVNGNRAAMRGAVAGPTAALTDQYRGAERGLERSGVQGGVKDLAKAELGRDRASKIAGLTTGVQPAAAAQLGDLGSRLTGQGATATHGAGQLYGNLLGQGFDNRKYAREEGEKASSSIGSLIFDILNGTVGKMGKKGGGGGSIQGDKPQIGGTGMNGPVFGPAPGSFSGWDS